MYFKKNLFYLAFSFAYAWFFFVMTPFPAVSQYGPDLSSIDTLLQDSLSNFHFPLLNPFSSYAVIIKRNDTIIYSRTNGTYDENTVKPIYSSTKWLSAATLLSLVDDNRLSLDDTIGSFLPIFTQYGKGRITIRQLLSHTSGLSGYSEQNYENSDSLSLAQSVDSIAVHVPLEDPPGSCVNYGSVSMQVAGRIAEIVSGKDWDTLFFEKIASKCQMPHTEYVKSTPSNPWIAGGAYSSLNEYMNFVRMLFDNGVFNGATVLSAQSISEFYKDQTNNVPVKYLPYPFSPPYHPYNADTIRYGLGNFIDVENPSNGYVEHISGPGAWGAYPWIDRCRNVSGMIFTYAPITQVMYTYFKLCDLVRRKCESICMTGIEEKKYDRMNSSGVVLVHSYPNPFNQATNITFNVFRHVTVTAAIYDVHGRIVTRLIEGEMDAGRDAIEWDGRDERQCEAPGGIYALKFNAGDYRVTKRIVLVR